MERKTELSFLNTLFCLLVIFIHVLSTPITTLEKGSLQYALVFVPWRLSAFVVQGFIFLAGVKIAFGFDRRINYKKYISARFSTVVIPYIFWVLIFYMYFISRRYFGFGIKDLVGYVLRGDLVSHFYFVIIIVQFYLLRPVWKIMTERVKFSVALILTAVAMILGKVLLSAIFGDYIDRIFTTYLIFWVCGCYFGANYEIFMEKIINKRKTITLFFFAVAILEALLSYLHFTEIRIGAIEGIHLTYCILAIMFFVSISFSCSKEIMKNRFLKEIDGASYYIYLVHPLFIFIIDEKMTEWGVMSIGTAFLVRTIVVYTASILVSIAYVKIKGKVKKLYA